MEEQNSQTNMESPSSMPQASQPMASSQPMPSGQAAPASTGLAKNVEAALSYVLGLITGLVFFLISKDKFVRFHALQSIMFSIFVAVVNIALSNLHRFWYSISGVWNLVVLVVYIFLIVKAYQNQMFKLPVIGDLAEKHA